MPERTLTLRFLGRDSGLSRLASSNAESIGRLGQAASLADQQLQRLGRADGFASFSRNVDEAGSSTGNLQARLGALTQANVDLAASLRIPVSSVRDLNRVLGTLPDRTAIVAAEYQKLQRSGTGAAEAQRILGRTLGVNERQFQALQQALGGTADQVEEYNRKLREAEEQQREFARAQLEAERLAERQRQEFLAGAQDLAFASTALAGSLGVVGAISFNNFARAEQQLAALTTAFGDAAIASDELARINEFAATTPFQIDALTDSYISLVNRGFNPTTEELVKLGDLAASQAKDFDQLTEAILDASSSEFERLKEFGILASSAGDEVTLAFRGIEVAVEKTPEAIRNALLEFGALEGIAGSLAGQSETAAGAVSNLEDSLTQASIVAGGFVAAGV